MDVALDLYCHFYEILEKTFKEKEFPNDKAPKVLKEFWDKDPIVKKDSKSRIEELFLVDSLYFYKLYRTAQKGPVISVKNISLGKALEYIGIKPEDENKYKKITDWDKKAKVLLNQFIKDYGFAHEPIQNNVDGAETENALIIEAKKVITNFFKAINSEEYYTAYRYCSPNLFTPDEKWDDFYGFEKYFNTESKKIKVEQFHIFQLAVYRNKSVECKVYFEEYGEYFIKRSYDDTMSFLNTHTSKENKVTFKEYEINLIRAHDKTIIQPGELGINEDAWNNFFFEKEILWLKKLCDFKLVKADNELFIEHIENVNDINTSNEGNMT